MTPPASALDRLLAIMARLRDPHRGCPWDLEQDFATIAPYTIEEAYEVADAIARGDMRALKDELGDLLFQIVFHTRMAEEAGLFDFADVAAAAADKMVRRHPHVFGDAEINTAAAQTEAWEQHKARERAAAAAADTAPSVLDGVALALPALTRAAKIQARAARIGFDWPDAAPVIDKLGEEIAELEAELDAGRQGNTDRKRVAEELGDILFAAANLARKLEIEPEASLRAATAKFERRFRAVEALAGERGIGHDLWALDALWQEVKQGENESGADPRSNPLPAMGKSEEPVPPQSEDQLRVRFITGALPEELSRLAQEARGEGYRMLDRLGAEWNAGEIRFDRPGEALLVAYANDSLVGIGGMTVERAIPGALRMRRFYVSPSFRRRGVARTLAQILLGRPQALGQVITVNASAASHLFWESLGFVADRRDGRTHVLRQDRFDPNSGHPGIDRPT